MDDDVASCPFGLLDPYLRNRTRVLEEMFIDGGGRSAISTPQTLVSFEDGQTFDARDRLVGFRDRQEKMLCGENALADEGADDVGEEIIGQVLMDGPVNPPEMIEEMIYNSLGGIAGREDDVSVGLGSTDQNAMFSIEYAMDGRKSGSD